MACVLTRSRYGTPKRPQRANSARAASRSAGEPPAKSVTARSSARSRSGESNSVRPTNVRTVFQVSAKLRERGWQVPAYTLPESLTDVAGLRIVVRNGFGRDMADLLLDDLRSATKFLEALPAPLPDDPSHTENFHH